MNKKEIKQTLIVAFWVVLASQFKLQFFVDEFIVTFAVVFFALFLYFYDELNPIVTGILTGLAAPVPRAMLLYLSNRNLLETLKITLPDVTFYISYGIMFYIFYYRSRNKSLTKFIITALGCEFFSNVIELSLITNFFVGVNGGMIKGIFYIALIRAVINITVIIILKRYNNLLSKEEHEIRYRNLIRQTSIFKSEIYFMHKNMFEIEDVMKRSFSFYKTVAEGEYPIEFKNMVLDIAKDVHEIKKVYMRVIKGLELMTEDDTDNSSINLKDMVNILEIYTKEYIKEKKLSIELEFAVGENFLVKEHFYLMSVLNNLLNNSIEAMEEKKYGLLKLTIFESSSYIIFRVTDNGVGIKQSNLGYIFNPGFSTKFDKTTGDIWRGIGLTLVRDLVTDMFHGTISVKSEENKNTEFMIKIPCEVIKEELA